MTLEAKLDKLAMNPAISVIICCHNPRLDYLEKVLDALKYQTLPIQQWELLLIDNASDNLLANIINLGWHPNARHIREEQLGITSARLRAFQEAKAELLVFVDYDNVLNTNYLEIAQQISEAFPCLGVWGGQITGDFEEPPPPSLKRHLWLLAIRSLDIDCWSNLLHQEETTPCGAGMVVRKTVGNEYTNLVYRDPRRFILGRKGQLLNSCEDTDIAFTACDMGLGTGRFVSLKLTHLISADRLKEEYLLRLCEALCCSSTILESFRGKLPAQKSKLRMLFDYYQLWRMSPIDRRFKKAVKRGQALALKQITKGLNATR